ncbi:MAG: MBOAT family O-acyltransferase [Planctomycetota bacterium]
MLFNSLTFLAFFAAVYSLYLLLRRSVGAQNVLLLAASYVFYGWWDWRLLSLLWVSTLVDYCVGLQMAAATGRRHRRALLLVSLTTNLGLLGVFKYFNFFAASAARVLTALGMDPSVPTLEIVLPVGISFYTFQTLSYSIDIYRERMQPTRNLVGFALYVAFFPQLVAGPIERARRLLPQVLSPRRICADQVDAAIFLILWGYFKKTVIADNLGRVADPVFDQYTNYSGANIPLATVAFALQIYCDFSAYSDIARGLAKLLGFELMINFKLPYFAQDPSDFWRRWHISLSTWLRDYLYVPLGGNRSGPLATYRNLLLTMLLGGLWHGAAWHFVLWGLFHGVLLMGYRIAGVQTVVDDAGPVSLFRPRIALRISVMLCFTLVGWILFRAKSLGQIAYMLSHLGFEVDASATAAAVELAFFGTPLLLMQLLQHYTRDLLAPTKWPIPYRALCYGWMLVWIFIFGVRETPEFIYFQF